VLAVARAGRHGAAVLAHATAGRMVAAWTLDPAPIDPAAHLEQTHARGRRHLRRLLDQPPGAEIRSPMTTQLFDRLTQPADSAKRKRIDYTSVESYTYTARKPLRRVLDHALDHLNQIDQWQLWRIDQAMRLLIQRAAALGPDELDWRPPDGGWPLRRVLHHVARSELLYAASFDEALPKGPAARYVEADARFGKRLVTARAIAGDESIVFPDPYGTFFAPGEVVAEILALECELITQAP
jgi:hypothetical protein